MSNLLEKIILLATRATLGTIACILVGTVCVYIVLFGNKKAPSNIQQQNIREIKQDVAHNQIKSTTPVDDEKHTQSIEPEKKGKEPVQTDKESDASVEAAKPEPFLAQYEATIAIVLRDAANYKPAPVKSIIAETKEEEEKKEEKEEEKKDVTARHVESSRKVKAKNAVAVAASAAVVTTASAVATALGTDQNITPLVKSKAPEPVLADYEATTASTALKAQEFIASLPKAPKASEHFLAAFEATTASTALEASQYIAALPKAPRPFLAAYEATTAITALEASKYVSTLPKAPKPSLAAFEATTSSVSLAASQYIAALPKAPRPFLAAYEATTAIAALEAQQFVAAMPKPPKPFLAAYEATTASVEMTAFQNIKQIVGCSEYTEALTESREKLAKRCEPSNPVLAAYENTTAECIVAAQNHVAGLVATEDYQKTLQSCREKQMGRVNKPLSSDNLSQYEKTTASTLSASRSYINTLTSDGDYLDAVKAATAKPQAAINKEEAHPTITTNLASLEAATAYQLLQQQQQQQHHVESDSDIEVEIEDNVLSSPSAISSVSSTTSTEHTRGINNHKKPSSISTTDAKAQFDVSWDQMYANNNNNSKKPAAVESPTSATPFRSTVECTYYPNCTNKNCKFVHPGNENNPKPKRAATMDAVYKKPWTKAERIERQSQTHFPTWKSRCVHWPYCTNNHCKYSHPIKECRMGEQCTFMDRCMFLHPSDFLEPVKKRYTPKRSQTLPHIQSQEPESLPQM